MHGPHHFITLMFKAVSLHSVAKHEGCTVAVTAGMLLIWPIKTQCHMQFPHAASGTGQASLL